MRFNIRDFAGHKNELDLFLCSKLERIPERIGQGAFGGRGGWKKADFAVFP